MKKIETSFKAKLFQDKTHKNSENHISQQKNRIEEIDYLRGFAILAVIAVHTSAYFTEITNIDLLLITNVIINVFSHFAVPLFIFISGFVLSLNYNTPFSKKSFYKKRIKSVIPQYIIFSIFYIVLNIVISSINGDLALPTIIEIIFYLLTASSSYHLWYFAIIIQLYILYPYIDRKYKEFTDNGNGRIFFFIGTILVIQQMWIIAKAITETYLSSITNFNSIPYFNIIIHILLTRVFLSQIFYFVLGVYIHQNYKNVKGKILKFKHWTVPLVLVITLILSILWINGIIEYGYYYNIPTEYFIVPNLIESFYFPLIFLILLVISFSFLNKKSEYSNFILLLGKYSFGIYLIHVFYIRLIVEIIYPHFNIDPNQWIFYPVLFVLTVLLSYFNAQQIARLPYSETIIGIKNPIS